MLSREQLIQFDRDGYLVIENFIDSDQCHKLYDEAGKIIENIIDKENLEDIPIFPWVLKDSQPSKSDLDYFEQSASDIKLFLNHKEFVTDQHRDVPALAKVLRKKANRLAHALHAIDPVFRQVTFSQKVKDVVESIGFINPIVCQSMYFMLQSPEGPSLTGHQASTYVLVEPNKVVCFCLAVTDSTMENGCLEVIPESHRTQGLLNKFVRKEPATSGAEPEERFEYTTKEPNYPQEGYVPICVKAGSLVIKDGLLIERVSECKVHEPSDVYAFHVYDADKTDFSEQNWMKFNEKTFLPLFETNEQ